MQNEGKAMGEKATISRWDIAALILLLASAGTGAVAFIADSHPGRVAFGVIAVVAFTVWTVAYLKRLRTR